MFKRFISTLIVYSFAMMTTMAGLTACTRPQSQQSGTTTSQPTGSTGGESTPTSNPTPDAPQNPTLGGQGSGGAGKPAVEFTHENFKALLSNPQVQKLLGSGLMITELKQTALKNKTWTYKVTSNSWKEENLCVFEVDIENGFNTIVADIKVSDVRVIDGCRERFTNTHVLKDKLRLSCLYMTGIMQDGMQYFEESPEIGIGSAANGKTEGVNIEFEEIAGSKQMICSKGCQKPYWKIYKNDPDSDFKGIKMLKPALNEKSFSWPAIEFTKGADNLQLKIEMMTALSENNQILTSVQPTSLEVGQTTSIFARGEILGRTNQSSEAAIAQVTTTRERAITKSHAWSELRCSILKPELKSDAELDEAFSITPSAGKISSKEYEKLNGGMLRSLDKPFVEFAKTATLIEPTHREAMLSQFAQSSMGLHQHILKNLPVLKEALKTNPQITVEDMWQKMADVLNMPPTSPSGVRAIAMLPLYFAL